MGMPSARLGVGIGAPMSLPSWRTRNVTVAGASMTTLPSTPSRDTTSRCSSPARTNVFWSKRGWSASLAVLLPLDPDDVGDPDPELVTAALPLHPSRTRPPAPARPVSRERRLIVRVGDGPGVVDIVEHRTVTPC